MNNDPKKLRLMIALGAGVLLLAGCGSSDAAEPGSEPEVVSATPGAQGNVQAGLHTETAPAPQCGPCHGGARLCCGAYGCHYQTCGDP